MCRRRGDEKVTFLPIVERELRVAALKRGTLRWRMTAVCLACVVACGALLTYTASAAPVGADFGQFLFNLLEWPCFIYACAAGIFLTSDCLAEEKREGTLGLLFLTDLRGYDVVLGKLFSSSLRAAYGMLAVFPIMAIAFTFGGVTPPEFWHVILLLCNALFFSLTLGMFVSSISRDSHKAMNGTLLLQIILVIALPPLERGLAAVEGAAYQPRLALLSPAFALDEAASVRANEFWWSMVWINSLGWTFLGLASWLTPRTWQAGNVRPTKASRGLPFFAGAAMNPAKRAKMLDENPIGWLIARDRWLHRAARIAVLFLVALTVAGLASGGADVMVALFGNFGVSLVVIVFELWIAAQVSRFYVDGRASGFLQTLLVTPLEPADIVRGHWLALRRLFLPPVLALLFMRGCAAVITLVTLYGALSEAAPPAIGIPAGPMQVLRLAGSIIATVMSVATLVTAMLVIGWFAIWTGLTSKKTNTAVVKTIFFSRLLPKIPIAIAAGALTVPLMAVFGAQVWGWHATFGLIAFGADLLLISLARTEVRKGFRNYVRGREPIGLPPPPYQPTAAVANAPPVIGPLTIR